LNDGQLYSVENVDFNYLLQRFNIEIPPDFNYTVDVPGAPVTVTPPPADTPQPVPEGGEGS
jgi:hypothetical protein